MFYSLLARDPDIVFHRHGCATAITIVSTTRTRKAVRRSLVRRRNSSVPTSDSVYKKRTSVMVYWIATTAAMSSVVVSVNSY